MQCFRCVLCGEVSFGENSPGQCPFCGGGSRFLQIAHDVIGEKLFVLPNISDESRKNLLIALNRATSNASFYKCVSNTSKSEATRALYKTLARTVREHADIMRKYLELDPIVYQDEECPGEDIDQMRETQSRIMQSIELYRSFIASSREAKIAEAFKAFMEAEQGFLTLIK